MTLEEKEARELLYRQLRNLRPVALVVVNGDGDERPIALRPGKGKWDHAADAVCSMLDDVERVEMRDASGGVLRVWTPPVSRAGAGAPLNPPASAPAAGAPTDLLAWAESFALRMVAASQSAADTAVQRHMAGTDAVMTRALEVLALTAAQNRELMQQQSNMLRAVYSATVAQGRAETLALQLQNAPAPEGDDSGADGMMQNMLVMAIAAKMGMPPQALMAMMGGAGGGAPDAPAPPASVVDVPPEKSKRNGKGAVS